MTLRVAFRNFATAPKNGETVTRMCAGRGTKRPVTTHCFNQTGKCRQVLVKIPYEKRHKKLSGEEAFHHAKKGQKVVHNDNNIRFSQLRTQQICMDVIPDVQAIIPVKGSRPQHLIQQKIMRKSINHTAA